MVPTQTHFLKTTPDNGDIVSRLTGDQKFELAKDAIRVGDDLLRLAGMYLEGRQRRQEREDEREKRWCSKSKR